ncbi:MAG: hypothetical protein MJY63_05510 [Paludibacteraceae bacterium]|nr:hypothetical protein [Paludibacteraceae bacterium]
MAVFETSANVNIPFLKTIKGNMEGYNVKDLRPSNKLSAGDGDINTGKGGKVYGKLDASIAQDGCYAKVNFQYMVWTDNWNSNGGDVLSITNSFDVVNLSNYDFHESWTCGNKSYDLRITYKLRSTSAALYKAWYNAKSGRTSWLNVDPKDFPTENKAQSWLPINKLKFKVDDKGNELTGAGNIGVEMGGYIPITVTRKLTITEKKPLQDSKDYVLTRDKSVTDLDQMLSYRDMSIYQDGFDSTKYIPIPENEGETGAWLRGERVPQKGITLFNMAKNTGDEFYCGQIIKIDEKLFEGKPQGINFYENERKPLDYVVSIHKSGMKKYLENVIPVKKNYRHALNEYTEKYRQDIASVAKIAQNVEIFSDKAESSQGINLGGTIKGVTFNIGANQNKYMQVFELRQKLFEVSLNDTFKKGSDYFTSNLNLSEFKKQLGHYTPAIVNRIDYGKIAYIAFTSDDSSAMDITISDFSGKIGGKIENCKIYVLAVGGEATAGEIASTLSKDAASEFIKKFGKTMDGNEVEAAVPISFEANYLGKPNTKVTLNKNRYFQQYVDKIVLDIYENNKGASASARLRCLDFTRDSRGNVGYEFLYKNKSLDFQTELSPWATCIEVKIDIKGATDSHDFNVFVPYIPLNSIRNNGNGKWVFKIHMGGSTLYNANNNVDTQPTVPGCYLSKNNGIYRGDLAESQYKNRSELQVLADYFNWCEEHYLFSNNFSRFGGEKKIKCTRD